MNWLRKRKKETEHRYFEEQLSAYLDGELLPRERDAIERHLAVCPACRWHLKTLRQTVQWTSELPTVRVPRAFAIPAPARQVPAARRRGFLPLLQGATALVALLLFFVVAGDAMLTGFQPIGRPSSEPETLLAEATMPAQAGGAQAEVAETMVVETVVVEKEGAALAMQEAPAAEASPETAAEAEDSAAKEAAEVLAAAPADAATVTVVAAMRATMAPAGMGGAVEEAVEEPPPAPEGDVRAAAPEPTGGMEAPAVAPMPTAVPKVEPPATRVAMPPPSAQVEVGEALSVPEVAQASEGSYGPRPTGLIWVRWGEYVLGVLLILLLGTTVGAMIWRRSRGGC